MNGRGVSGPLRTTRFRRDSSGDTERRGVREERRVDAETGKVARAAEGCAQLRAECGQDRLNAVLELIPPPAHARSPNRVSTSPGCQSHIAAIDASAALSNRAAQDAVSSATTQYSLSTLGCCSCS